MHQGEFTCNYEFIQTADGYLTKSRSGTFSKLFNYLRSTFTSSDYILIFYAESIERKTRFTMKSERTQYRIPFRPGDKMTRTEI